MIQDNSRILVPFDSTELAIKALDRACEVAKNTNSEAHSAIRFGHHVSLSRWNTRAHQGYERV